MDLMRRIGRRLIRTALVPIGCPKDTRRRVVLLCQDDPAAEGRGRHGRRSSGREVFDAGAERRPAVKYRIVEKWGFTHTYD